MRVQPHEQPCPADIRPIVYESGTIKLVDQRKLPFSLEYVEANDINQMCHAIRQMIVRGAPAIGLAAALSLALEGDRISQEPGITASSFLKTLKAAKLALDATRPTAVNLAWATGQVYDRALAHASEPIRQLADGLMSMAQQMLADSLSIDRALSECGAQLIEHASGVLTHCNAGALATGGWGTALGVIRSAYLRGARPTIFVDETRPRQQGARLTSWELLQDQITPVLITDSMAGYLMSRGKIDVVVTGADRIAANGDTANKIGTYSLAVLARYHRIPFYIAAPLSTFDLGISCGDSIPIEERDHLEVTTIEDRLICPPEVRVMNPAFDVTPACLISGIITEIGLLQSPYPEAIRKAFQLSSESRLAQSGANNQTD